MTFLNPIVLFGLIAASIPVILHLLNLRKLKIIEFSSLRFLKELQKTKIRKLKLKQIILLILRTLAIIFLVLAFSRPTIKSNLPLIGTYAKTTSIIIIDNSFSLDVSDEFGNRYNQVKNLAYSIIKSLKEGDEAAVVFSSESNSEQNVTLTRNKSFLTEQIAKSKISYVPMDLVSNLRYVQSLMSEHNNINKEVFIISDFQSNIFRNTYKDSLKLFDNNTIVYCLPVGSKSNSSIQNLSVDSVGFISRIFQKGKLAEFEVQIRNNSNKEVKGVLVSMFYENERVAQKTIDIPANQTKSVNLAAEPQKTGIIKGMIEIDNDALETDNKRYFSFIIPDKPKVLLTGSESKTKFIDLALNLKSNGESSIETKSIKSSEIQSTDLKSYDLVIAAGGPFTNNDFSRFSQYINDGGSILLFADDQTESNTFISGAEALGLGKLQFREYSQNQPISFSSNDKLHPLLTGVFKGTTESKSIVESPKINKILSTGSGQIIIQTPAGGFLSEVRKNDGRLLYIGVTPDMSWSSFPLTGLFPALLNRSVYYLSLKENTGISANLGANVRINLPKKFAWNSNVKMIDPTGNHSTRKTVQLATGTLLELDNLSNPGVFSFLTESGKEITSLSMNIDPTESNLNLTKEANLKSNLKSNLNNNVALEIIDYTKNLSSSLERARTGSELWQLFVLLALALLVTEMIISKTAKSEL